MPNTPIRRLWQPAALGLLLSTAALAQYPGTTPIPEQYRKGFEAISLQEARSILGFLAGPECEGRGSGQPGYQKAAEYVAARFKEYGLKPVGDNGTYFQNVPFTRSRVSANDSYIQVGDFKQTALRVTSGLTEYDQTADVVFVRVNGQNQQLESLEPLNGKIVVLSASPSNRTIRTQMFRSDAVAILTINPSPAAVGEWGSVRPAQGGRGGGGRGGGGSRAGGIAGTLRADLSPAEAKALAQALGVDPGVTIIDESASDSVKIANGTKQAHLAAKMETQEIGVPNVVGLIEGSDPVLKGEYVGIGAHLDHMGKNAQGVIYYGADDDGSGSTAIMLIAKAYHESGLKPKRSILFMAFCAEEMGLVGSRYLANNPMIPLDKMIAEFQMDMVGRDSDGVQNGDRNRVDKAEENIDTMRLVGSKRISTELDAMVQEMNKHIGFKFKYDSEDVYTRSDHYNFAAKGIPIAFLFDGFHPDYHRPTDTPDKINYEKLTNAAKLFFLCVDGAANREKPFAKDVPQGSGGLVPAGPPL